MDFFLLAIIAAAAVWSLKSRGERARIARLARHLRQFEIEKLMETLSEGYLRALGEEDAQRQQAIWSLLESSERRISEQFRGFAQSFAQESVEHSRVMRMDWPMAALLGALGRAFPSLLERQSFDMRRLLELHAQAIVRAAQATQQPAAARAYTLLAELMLMQHSCHWYCKSRNVASARLLLRHQTPYQKVLASVAPETRQSYQAITGV
jgi:hypothetical protein